VLLLEEDQGAWLVAAAAAAAAAAVAVAEFAACWARAAASKAAVALGFKKEGRRGREAAAAAITDGVWREESMLSVEEGRGVSPSVAAAPFLSGCSS